VKKKTIIITAAAALVSFAAAFVAAWLATADPVPDQAATAAKTTGATTNLFTPGVAPTAPAGLPPGSYQNVGLTRQRLNDLVRRVRASIQQYQQKLESLDKRQQRLKLVQEQLKADVEKLNNLRVELASIVDRLKAEQEKLLATRIEIARSEKANLQTLAGAYDKMDPAGASKILAGLCRSADSDDKSRVYGGPNSNMDDAVKILHFMQDRTKAKLLAELVNAEPKLAAALCERLKRIVEQQ